MKTPTSERSERTVSGQNVGPKFGPEFLSLLCELNTKILFEQVVKLKISKLRPIWKRLASIIV